MLLEDLAHLHLICRGYTAVNGKRLIICGAVLLELKIIVAHIRLSVRASTNCKVNQLKKRMRKRKVGFSLQDSPCA